MIFIYSHERFLRDAGKNHGGMRRTWHGFRGGIGPFWEWGFFLKKSDRSYLTAAYA